MRRNWQVYYTHGGPPYNPYLTKPSTKWVARMRAARLRCQYTDAVQVLPRQEAEAAYEQRADDIATAVLSLRATGKQSNIDLLRKMGL